MTSADTRRSSRLLLLLLPACVAAAAALVLSLLQDPVYEASARVVVAARITVGSDDGDVVRAAVPLRADVELAESGEVRATVQDELGLEALPPVADARPIDRDAGLEIAVRSGRAEDAAVLADAYAEAYVDARNQRALVAFEDAVREAESRRSDLVAELEGLPDDDPEREELAQRIDAADALLSRMLDDTIVAIGSADVVAAAEVPAEAADPRPLRDVLLAAAAGLLIGLLVLLVLDYRDDVLLTRRDLARKASLDVFAVLPAVDDDERGDLALEGERRASSMELLAAIESREPGLAVLQLLPGSAGADAAGVATALALAEVEVGHNVALLDVDLEGRPLDSLFGLDGAPGLADVVGGVEPAEVVHRRHGVSVYGAGTLAAADPAVFLNPRFGRLVAAMARHYDRVILVGPFPDGVTPSAGAVAEATILVVPSGAKGAAVTRARASVRGAGGGVPGAVLLERTPPEAPAPEPESVDDADGDGSDGDRTPAGGDETPAQPA